MNEAERVAKLEAFGLAPDRLAAILRRFPRKMWQFRPSPDAWTIHELIVHLADAETIGYGRCRKALAEPGSAVMTYDEGRWAASLQYHQQDPELARRLFRLLRVTTYRLLDSLPDSAWSQTIVHPESGPMTLDDWLHTYDNHATIHMRQMQANHAAWRERSGLT
jgi:uncharacterized damage-inducible protein DinB